jgi:hypothetical protein
MRYLGVAALMLTLSCGVDPAGTTDAGTIIHSTPGYDGGPDAGPVCDCASLACSQCFNTCWEPTHDDTKRRYCLDDCEGSNPMQAADWMHACGDLGCCQ